MISRRLFMLGSTAASMMPFVPKTSVPQKNKLRPLVFGDVRNARLQLESDLTIKVDGVTDWIAIYDRGVKFIKVAGAPGPGEWTVTADGDAMLGATVSGLITADLSGFDVPPNYVMGITDFAGCVPENVRYGMMV